MPAKEERAVDLADFVVNCRMAGSIYALIAVEFRSFGVLE